MLQVHIQDHGTAKEEGEGCLLMMIEPNPVIISHRTKEHALWVNITIPQMLLERADRCAKATNINRSRLIAEALEHQISVAY